MKLHLGCDKRYLPGFVHIDVADYPHIDHRHDARTLPMIADGAAELVYACHMLEYFDRVEVQPVLAEWRRVLRPGGTLRLAVPDFEALVAVYGKYGDLNRLIGPLYGRWPVPGAGLTIYHRTVYDLASIRVVLESAGFRDVQRYDWHDVLPEGYDDYSRAYVPHMDQSGILISLNVSCTRDG